MKHPKKQLYQKFNVSTEQNNPSNSGTVTSMVGKDTFSLTFNIDVASALDIDHKETLKYEVSGDQLIVRKISG
jgi:hypothetical protein